MNSPDAAQIRRQLRLLLTENFDLEELRTLAFDLGVDFDNLRGEGKEAKARELVAYLERSGRLGELVDVIRELRPRLGPFLPRIPPAPTPSPPYSLPQRGCAFWWGSLIVKWGSLSSEQRTAIVSLLSIFITLCGMALILGKSVYSPGTTKTPPYMATSTATSTPTRASRPTPQPTATTTETATFPPIPEIVGEGFWTQRASMATARDRPGVVGLNGKIYVFGGSNASGALNSVEIYNPNTDTWKAGPSMPGPKSAASAVVVNGLIYVLGGNESVYSLDPSTNVWSIRAPIPVTFSGPAAIAVLDNKIYLTQGSQWMYCYDPITDHWSPKTPIPIARSIASFAPLNGKLYAIGGNAPGKGRTEIARIDIYDPVTDSWVIDGAAPLDTPRTHLGSPMPVVNERIYVMAVVTS